MLSRNTKIIYLIWLLPLFIFVALQFLGYDGLYGQDSYEYIRYSKALKSFIITGEYPGDLVWPKGYPILIVFFSFLLPTIFSAQLISLISIYGTAFFLHKILKLIYKENESYILLIPPLLLIAPYMLRISLVVMADSLSIFCLLTAAYFSLSYQAYPRFRNLLFFILFAAFAVISRYAALIAVFPFLIWTTICWFKVKKKTHILALLPGFILLFVHLFLEGKGSDFTGHYFIKNWSFSNFFSRSFIINDYYQLPDEHYILPNLLYYIFTLFHPGFFILTLPIIIIFRKKIIAYSSDGQGLFLIASIAYVLFLSAITFQSPRYLSLIYPYFLIFIFPAFSYLVEKFRAKKYSIIFGLTFIQLVLFLKAFYLFYSMNQFEQYLAKELEPFQSEVLYTFEVDIALQNRGLEFEYMSMWETKHKQFEEGAYVLFNAEHIAKKFTDKNPMINWEYLNETKVIKKIKDLEQGWKLYRIES